jgi:hypothetical protein
MIDISLVKKVSGFSTPGMFKKISPSKSQYSVSFPFLLGGKRDNILRDGNSRLG